MSLPPLPSSSSRSSSLCLFLGLLLLVHCTLSAIHFRHYIRASSSSSSSSFSLPSDLMIELFLSFFLCAYGSASYLGDFKRIRSAPILYERVGNAIMYREEFHVFNHRGKGLKEMREKKKRREEEERKEGKGGKKMQ